MSLARVLANGWIRGRTRALSDSELAAPALVFSPHFDDETLGCGGTILRKRALDASVSIAFLTDGRASHRDWVGEEELIGRRADEGRAAAEKLGVDPADVLTLGFEETRLGECSEAATERVASLIAQRSPQQVFVPSRREPPADHAATFEIVSQALARQDRPVDLFEYPIWLWRQWPWTGARPPGGRNPARSWVRRMRGLGRFLGGFDCRVDVRSELAAKRAALEQHRSQVERPASHSDWPILADVDQGAFVECFFQGFEIFARSRSGGGSSREDR